jgi:hypothetical protein
MANPEEEFRQTVRIIDTSLNRIGEGSHFLQEFVRMPLIESSLIVRLSTIQCLFLTGTLAFNERLIHGENIKNIDSDVIAAGADSLLK